MPILNELVFKNDLINKKTSFFVLIEGFHSPHSLVSVLEDRTFHYKVLSKLDRSINFNILVNYKFVSF